MTTEVDTHDPAGIARWLRERAQAAHDFLALDSEEQQRQYLNKWQQNVLPHLAFRFRQAAKLVEELAAECEHLRSQVPNMPTEWSPDCTCGMDPKFWRHDSQCPLRYWYECRTLQGKLSQRKKEDCLAMTDEFGTMVCSLPEGHSGPHQWVNELAPGGSQTQPNQPVESGTDGRLLVEELRELHAEIVECDEGRESPMMALVRRAADALERAPAHEPKAPLPEDVARGLQRMIDMANDEFLGWLPADSDQRWILEAAEAWIRPQLPVNRTGD